MSWQLSSGTEEFRQEERAWRNGRTTQTRYTVRDECPGGAEYGHGFSRTTVHAGGCCERWAASRAASAALSGGASSEANE